MNTIHLQKGAIFLKQLYCWPRLLFKDIEITNKFWYFGVQKIC